MSIYAAYGGNLNPASMQQIAPHTPVVGTGWIRGWRLTFGGEDISWQGAMPTLVEAEDSQVFVMVYELSDHDAAALDAYEGFELGLYRKIHLQVSCLEKDLIAWVYVLNGYEGGFPLQSTVDIIAESLTAADAPADYIQDLRNRPTSE